MSFNRASNLLGKFLMEVSISTIDLTESDNNFDENVSSPRNSISKNSSLVEEKNLFSISVSKIHKKKKSET